MVWCKGKENKHADMNKCWKSSEPAALLCHLKRLLISAVLKKTKQNVFYSYVKAAAVYGGDNDGSYGQHSTKAQVETQFCKLKGFTATKNVGVLKNNGFKKKKKEKKKHRLFFRELTPGEQRRSFRSKRESLTSWLFITSRQLHV